MVFATFFGYAVYENSGYINRSATWLRASRSAGARAGDGKAVAQ
jgi:hypothetical protein